MKLAGRKSALALRLPRFGEERASFGAFLSICACLVFSVSSSSWCLGRAAVCNCGTPWTFLLPLLVIQTIHTGK